MTNKGRATPVAPVSAVNDGDGKPGEHRVLGKGVSRAYLNAYAVEGPVRWGLGNRLLSGAAAFQADPDSMTGPALAWLPRPTGMRRNTLRVGSLWASKVT